MFAARDDPDYGGSFCAHTHPCDSRCPSPKEKWIDFFNRECRSPVTTPPSTPVTTPPSSDSVANSPSSGGNTGNAGSSRNTGGQRSVSNDVPTSDLVGFLENPGDGSYQSGIGIISGWICDADEVDIEFDGDRRNRVPAAYGTSREDTLDACGDTDNGFGLLFNWNLLGDGDHTVAVYVDGEPWLNAEFTVTTFGEEFARSLFGMCVVADFPSLGEEVTLRWQESSQNFVIVNVE